MVIMEANMVIMGNKASKDTMAVVVDSNARIRVPLEVQNQVVLVDSSVKIKAHMVDENQEAKEDSAKIKAPVVAKNQGVTMGRVKFQAMVVKNQVAVVGRARIKAPVVVRNQMARTREKALVVRSKKRDVSITHPIQHHTIYCLLLL
ncbi:Hypothetical predicted protein [Pelobates cultripes]|nr:Hypothetical predicted protein [Pelobates cultripes]